MDQDVTDFIETRRSFGWRRPLGSVATGHRSPLAKLGTWRKRRRTIHDLEALDDRMLADIGLSREQIRPLVEDLLNAGAAGAGAAGAGAAGPSAANDNRAAVAAEESCLQAQRA